MPTPMKRSAWPAFGVVPAVYLSHIVDLGEVVLDQPCDQPRHARSATPGRAPVAPRSATSCTGRGRLQVTGDGGGALDCIHRLRPRSMCALAIGHMHPDGVGVRIQADQQQVDGGTAAEAVLDRLPEGQRVGPGRPAAAASFEPWAAQPSMVRIRPSCSDRSPPSDSGSAYPRYSVRPRGIASISTSPHLVDRVLDIEQPAGVGLAPHRAEGQTQHVADRVGQAAVRTGRHIQLMETAGPGGSGRSSSDLASAERVVREEVIRHPTVGLEHAPGEQTAQVELSRPRRPQACARADRSRARRGRSTVPAARNRPRAEVPRGA